MDGTRIGFAHSFCGCGGDAKICCQATFCLPCLYGTNVAKTRDDTDSMCGWMWPCLGYMFCPCISCCTAGMHRAELRERYHLLQEPITDCCAHCCCCTCWAVMQEAGEHKARNCVAAVSVAPRVPSQMLHYPTQPVSGAPEATVVAPPQELAFYRNKTHDR